VRERGADALAGGDVPSLLSGTKGGEGGGGPSPPSGPLSPATSLLSHRRLPPFSSPLPLLPPRSYAGYSSCFRKEAGSHGRDAWGIFRVHQFEKIEQFVVCEPEKSAAMHKEMIASAEDYYKALGIPYRVVNIVSGELNNAAAIKYDLEGWFPTLARYRELVSCSNCTDYQARAMEVRCGGKKTGDKEKKYCHFLNSTLCATTRTICAILENYQQADGVRVPDVLVPFMGGRTFLPFTREKPVTKDQPATGGAAAATKAPAAAAKAPAASNAAAAPGAPQ
jgi:hypothetical protein